MICYNNMHHYLSHTYIFKQTHMLQVSNVQPLLHVLLFLTIVIIQPSNMSAFSSTELSKTPS